MVEIAFRFAGPTFDSRAFVGDHGVEADHIWSAGETNSLGKVADTSGFSVSLESCASTAEVESQIAEFTRFHGAWLRLLPAEATHRHAHVGLMVGSSESFAPCVRFSSALLASVAAIGIGIAVSGYPCSDED